MNEAVQTLDYEGKLVVQSEGQLNAMHLVHRVDDGAEIERVVSLTGRPREIVRNGSGVICRFAGGERSINIRRRSHGRSFSPLHGVSSEQLGASYRIEEAAPARVAGREARSLIIHPLDDLRFGYRLYIDRKSALPLRSTLVDQNDNVVSQMMFVELQVGEGVSAISQDLATMQRSPVDPASAGPSQRLAPTGWEFEALPPGFRLNAHLRRPLTDDLGDVEHFMFSDGLATVSVYVHEADGSPVLHGVSKLGPARVVGRVLDGHQVIVVGEVPTRTLEWFADTVRAAGP